MQQAHLHRLGGRKFILALVVVAMAFILCLLEKISDQVFATVALGTAGVFVAGNTTQRWAPPQATVATKTTSTD